MARTKLRSETILAIYEEHQDEIDEYWVDGDPDDSMRDAVELWLADQLCGQPVRLEEL